MSLGRRIQKIENSLKQCCSLYVSPETRQFRKHLEGLSMEELMSGVSVRLKKHADLAGLSAEELTDLLIRRSRK